MSKDILPDEFLRDVEVANQIIQESYLLAARIALHQELRPDQTMPYEVYEDVEDLNDQIDRVSHLEVTFSGIGCIPTELPDGDPVSIYSRAESLQGNLEYISLMDPDYMTFESPDDVDEYLEDSGDLMYELTALESLKKNMMVPKSGMSLYTEFLLYALPEDEISGSAIRAPSIEYHALIDSSTLTIDTIDPEQKTEACEPDEVPVKLLEFASLVRNKLMDTGFRRLPASRQAVELDYLLNKINRDIRIDRFMTIFNPQDLYVPDTSHDNHRMSRVDVSDYPYLLGINCMRIDSLEYLSLTNGLMRIASNSKMRDHSVSFCIVGQIDEVTRKILNLPTDIVWVPVRPLARSRRKRTMLEKPTIYDASFVLLEDI